MSWAEIRTNWSSGWKELEKKAVETWRFAIEASPQDFAPKVQATIDELRQARVHLDRIKAMLPREIRSDDDQKAVANFSRLAVRWHELAAGVYADAEGEPAVGALPLLIVAGIGLGIAGIAWAVAAWEYCKNLREQTALADRELSARVEASREGRVLQDSTLPKPDPPSSEKVGWFVLGGLGLLTAALVVPQLMKNGATP